MKKLFNINITWKRLIIFSILIGIYTGIVMCIPFLKETSLQDIGISYECWVLFAVIIVVNSNKWYDAMIKCFIFFLISQPLVYITEWVLGSLSFNVGLYYYKTIWLPMTMLTIPGGLIAYFSKKQNFVGAFILGIGNTIQLSLCVHYILCFPNHLLSSLFCIWSIIFMTLGIQKKKGNRIISFIVPTVLTMALIGYCLINGLSLV